MNQKEITVYAVRIENGSEQYFKTAAAARYWKAQDDRRVYMGKRKRSETEAWYAL